MKTIAAILVGLLGSLSMITVSDAQDLKVVTEHLEPYNFQKDGNVTGMATDVVRAVLDQAGIQADMKVYPWARAYKMAMEQPNVLIFSMTRTAEREALFHWIGEVAPPLEVYLYKRKDRDDVHITSFEDAKRYKIGGVRDDITHKLLLEQGLENETHLMVSPDYENVVKLLFLDRVDAIPISLIQFATTLKKLGHSADEVEQLLPLMQQEEGLYLACSLNTPDDLVESLRAAFEEVKASGRIQEIWDRYFVRYGITQ